MRLVWWEREMRERLCCRSGRSIGVRDLRWKTTDKRELRDMDMELKQRTNQSISSE